MNPTMKEPYSQQWSLNMQYGFGNYVAELGYVGTKGTHLNASYGANQALLASPEHPIHDQTTNSTGNLNQRVPILGFTTGGLSEYDNVFDSNYNSLQASLRKHFSNRRPLRLRVQSLDRRCRRVRPDVTSRLANTPAISTTIALIAARLVSTAHIALWRVNCMNFRDSESNKPSTAFFVAGLFPVFHDSVRSPFSITDSTAREYFRQKWICFLCAG
jgi:hypothetical protein